jgi:hypothetical protein
MAVSNPRSPIRADYRFLQTLMQSTLGGKVEQVPKEFEMLSRVFVKAGGSWERVFAGSPGDVNLLKRLLRRAYETNHLTKKYQWDKNN